jgi:hypothetical protein
MQLLCYWQAFHYCCSSSACVYHGTVTSAVLETVPSSPVSLTRYRHEDSALAQPVFQNHRFQVSHPVCCSGVAVSAATAVAAVLLLLACGCVMRADAAVAPS